MSDDIRQQMARMAAVAAWGLGKALLIKGGRVVGKVIDCIVVIPVGNWDSMEEYTCMIPRETQDGAFYRAALALHQNHYQQAQAVS